jgi:hypothetical protein
MKCIFKTYKDGKIYRYIVKVTINKERHYVGCYKTEREAIEGHRRYMEKQARAEARLFENVSHNYL